MSLNLIVIFILIGGYFSGKIADKAGLPSVFGMTLWGIFLSVVLKNSIPQVLWDISPFLKNLALIIILLRAGLGIKKETLLRVGKTAGLLSFIPATLEAFAVALACHYLLKWSLPVSFLTGFLLAAVSPAVVVPSMLDFMEKGYGKEKEIPTVILAGASLDDVYVITVFTIILNYLTSSSVSLMSSLTALPVSLFLGILPGVVLGFFLAYVFNKHHSSIRATEKVLLILGCALILLQAGETWGTAALLGVMTTGFILLEKAPPIASELAAKLSKGWVFAEIILFVLIGMSVDVSQIAKGGLQGLLILFFGLTARSIGVVVSTIKSGLNWKERFFCVIAYLPKATVQAAMGSVPLAMGVPHGQTILAYAVLAIVISAPLGLIGIRWGGKVLLERAL